MSIADRTAITFRFVNEKPALDLTAFLTVRERVLLAHVLADGGPLTTHELAGRAGISSTTAAPVLRELFQAGLIERSANRNPHHLWYAPERKCGRCNAPATQVEHFHHEKPIWPSCANHHYHGSYSRPIDDVIKGVE